MLVACRASPANCKSRAQSLIVGHVRLRDVKLRVCSQCHLVSHCSPACQKLNRGGRGHKRLCGILQQLRAGVLGGTLGRADALRGSASYYELGLERFMSTAPTSLQQALPRLMSLLMGQHVQRVAAALDQGQAVG